MSDQDDNCSGTRFSFTEAPFSSVQRMIADGLASQVDLAELAAEIREHGISEMPEEVVSFLCDQLEDKIERRGRKAMGSTDKKLTAIRAAMLYRAVRQAQQNPHKSEAELVELIESQTPMFPTPIADNEAAWRIVSILVHGNDGHHKSVANLVSEYAPLSSSAQGEASSRK